MIQDILANHQKGCREIRMEFSINMGQWNAVFAVPAAVVDEHMKLAGAAQLKVLLYLLRHAGQPVTLEQLSFAVGQKPADTQDAVDYWVNCGVFSRSGDTAAEDAPPLSPASSVPAPDTAPEEPAQGKQETSPAETISAASIANALGQSPLRRSKDKLRYPFDECMKYVAEDEGLRNMLTTVEASLGKQLTHTEVSCFVTLVKWYGMPCTIVPMLIQYCKSIGKCSISYIESTGIGWTEEEIDNFEKAEQKISALTSRRRAWTTVRSALEIPERKATESEMKYSDLWINAQQLDIELIRHAYDKCVNKNGKISFAYMNGILKRYFEQGITDIASALRLDEQHREEMETRRAARKEADAGSISRLAGAHNSSGRYGETYATEEIEAILDAEWMSKTVGSDSDYDYDD